VKTILVSSGVALLLALFCTPLAIKLFQRRGYGQLIREEGPSSHQTKRGTPTMGGTVIVIASLIGYFIGHVATRDPMSASGLLVLMLMTGLGLVGFIDDFIKIYKQTSLGLRSGAKLAGQPVVGALFALLVLRYADGYDITPADAHVAFLRDLGPCRMTSRPRPALVRYYVDAGLLGVAKILVQLRATSPTPATREGQ